MEIVINISYDVYKKALVYKGEQLASNNANDLGELIIAVANGTPLPKGHGKLVDADAYIDKQEECGWLDDIPISEFNRIAPTIIEASSEED